MQNSFPSDLLSIPSQISTDKYSILEYILKEFERIPYENLTKRYLLRYSGNLLHDPEDLFKQHKNCGSGGTCFSIVYALKHILSRSGIDSSFILADRHYGANTHCALIANIGNEAYICDPGYFIFTPVKIGAKSLDNDFNKIEFRYPDMNKIDVFTVEQKLSKKRCTLKLDSVSKTDFIQLWMDSYRWKMMDTPLVMKKTGKTFYYLKPDFISIKSPEKSYSKHLTRIEFMSYLNELGLHLDSKLSKVL
ncbi:MAG: arylamine N-acetyltransferase [Planctomycetes bacterium]|nr:arylamine N-acetyltransferase [Planctomycetota bacterium]